ncbi:hypothetical protein CEXT_457001 [Caerostris extrusa]|uniref:Uncharacterized protein n=1 Tax=Caerostris extrusa TaxID=172846 RepID=A0AAV4MI74_CAEEX|nr:hypothetical protein CEXT_457001 [Caerostris extrusa]
MSEKPCNNIYNATPPDSGKQYFPEKPASINNGESLIKHAALHIFLLFLELNVETVSDRSAPLVNRALFILRKKNYMRHNSKKPLRRHSLRKPRGLWENSFF